MPDADNNARRVIRVERGDRGRAVPSTMAERIEAVWSLTLNCLAWGRTHHPDHVDEHRLCRSHIRIQRR